MTATEGLLEVTPRPQVVPNASHWSHELGRHLNDRLDCNPLSGWHLLRVTPKGAVSQRRAERCGARQNVPARLVRARLPTSGVARRSRGAAARTWWWSGAEALQAESASGRTAHPSLGDVIASHNEAFRRADWRVTPRFRVLRRPPGRGTLSHGALCATGRHRRAPALRGSARSRALDFGAPEDVTPNAADLSSGEEAASRARASSRPCVRRVAPSCSMVCRFEDVACAC